MLLVVKGHNLFPFHPFLDKSTKNVKDKFDRYDFIPKDLVYLIILCSVSLKTFRKLDK